MSECIRIPATARQVVPQAEIDALAAKRAAPIEWMAERERQRQAHQARLQAARDAAAAHFFKRPPQNVTRIDEARKR